MVGPFDCNYLKNRELSNDDDDDDGSENVAKKLNLPRSNVIASIWSC